MSLYVLLSSPYHVTVTPLSIFSGTSGFLPRGNRGCGRYLILCCCPLSPFQGDIDPALCLNLAYRTAQCQNLSINDQLQAGVRFLDIRCHRQNDCFAIYHGTFYEGQLFDDVLRTCVAFLAKDTTETIIMSVQDEGGGGNCTRSFEETFLFLGTVPKKLEGVFFSLANGQFLPKARRGKG